MRPNSDAGSNRFDVWNAGTNADGSGELMTFSNAVAYVDSPGYTGWLSVDPVSGAMAESAERAKFGPQPHGHEVMHNNGEATVNGRLLREIGDVLAPDAIEMDPALHRSQLTDDSLQ